MLTGRSGTNKYYAHFCGVLAHERIHANHQLSLGGGPEDWDGDGLTNSFEDNTSKTDRNDQFSAARNNPQWSELVFDDEAYAGGPVEEQGVVGANTTQDWAYPGSNSKQ